MADRRDSVQFSLRQPNSAYYFMCSSTQQPVPPCLPRLGQVAQRLGLHSLKSNIRPAGVTPRPPVFRPFSLFFTLAPRNLTSLALSLHFSPPTPSGRRVALGDQLYSLLSPISPPAPPQLLHCSPALGAAATPPSSFLNYQFSILPTEPNLRHLRNLWFRSCPSPQDTKLLSVHSAVTSLWPQLARRGGWFFLPRQAKRPLTPRYRDDRPNLH